MKDDSRQRLYKLDELRKYEVAKDNLDVRGWPVIGFDGERLGEVDELIVDTEAQRVRYLDVVLSKDIHAGKSDRHILIPIGAAQVNDAADYISVNHLDRSRVRFYPVYDGDVITREYEHSLRESVRMERTYAKVPDESFVRQDHREANGGDHEQQIEHKEVDRERLEKEAESSDPVVRMRAERDLARAERDIARAERDMMKIQRDYARSGLDKDFYENELYNEDHFYENRKKDKH